MPIVVDGVTIQACTGVNVDAINMDIVEADNTTVYDEYCGPCEIVFDTAGNHTWTVPSGVTSVDLCMIGGGSGGSSEELLFVENGGGWAGDIYSGTVAVTPGDTINITVGAAGAGGIPCGASGAGGSTTFGSITVAGGASVDTSMGLMGYHGNGASRSGCWGTSYDGTTHLDFYGGQAGFGNGGQGGCDFDCEPQRLPTPGVRGAGGGSSRGYCGATTGDPSILTSGQAGGVGEVRLSWDCP